jgi:hypothetical protein
MRVEEAAAAARVWSPPVTPDDTDLDYLISFFFFVCFIPA